MNVIRLASRRADRAEIEAQAQAWVIRLDACGGEGGCSAEELRRLGDWLDRTPLHRQVFQESAALWMGMDQLSGLLDLADTLRRERAPCRRRRFGLAGAALAMALALWLLLPAGTIDEGQLPYTEYQTLVGEIREQVLPDGSVISLNTNTRVSVSYRKDARLVHLSAGEAYFEVAPDPARPFWVYAGNYAVRAVGTAFSVHSGEQGLDVIVTDGRIEVSAFEQDGAERAAINLERVLETVRPVPLDKGQKGLFSVAAEGEHKRISEVDASHLDRSLSWREGMLIFNSDPLARVVEELSRYTSLRLIISDASLREERFGGYLPVNDISVFLATLEGQFGVQVDRIAPDLVYLSRAGKP